MRNPQKQFEHQHISEWRGEARIDLAAVLLH
jgi:hypothetical protein